jgi:3-oxoacyl-[acyl-carrier protein] reductase
MKRVIVTGDSKGLGKEIASQILRQTSYGVIGISRSKSDVLLDIDSSYSDKYVHLSYDLKNIKGIKDLYINKIKSIGPVYGLVNNSALAYDDIVTNLNSDALEDMFKVNVYSAMLLTKYAIRDMILHKTSGSLVHISSVCAHTGYKGLSMYAASKGALEAFSKNVAREWGGIGIRSNCVAPGFMETSMSSALTEDQRLRIYKRTSLKKETLKDSVAQAVVYLLSEGAASVTGTVLHVDSGTV